MTWDMEMLVEPENPRGTGGAGQDQGVGGRTGQGRARQGRAGQGRAAQGRARSVTIIRRESNIRCRSKIIRK
jgi:hypothetical protein